jgi:hypothetical protein
MSTSVTHPQTLKTVAATIAAIASGQTPHSAISQALQPHAQKMVTDIGAVTGQKSDVQDVAFSVYEALRAMNHTSLFANYPKLDSMRHDDSHNLTAQDFNVDNLSDNVVLSPEHSKVDSMIFLRSCLDQIDQGHYEVITNYNLSANLKRMDSAIGQAMTLSTRNPPLPSTVAESLTRMQTNGDYIHDLQNGSRSSFEQLTLIADDSNQVSGADVFMKMYVQANSEAETIALPLNGQLQGPSVRSLRTGEYNLSGDIPYPTQEDADTINRAIDVVRNAISSAKLVDSQGADLFPYQSDHARSVYNHFADNHQRSSNQLSGKEFHGLTHLPFTMALKSVAVRHVQRHEYTLLLDGSIPNIASESKPNHSIPERVRHIQAMQSETKGKLMILKGNDEFEIANLQQRFPNTHAIPVLLSDKDVESLPRTVSPAQFLLHNLVHQLHENQENGALFSLPALEKALLEHLPSLLPGVDETIKSSVIDALSQSEPYWNASFIATRIEDNLPHTAKVALREPGGLTSLSGPSIDDIANDKNEQAHQLMGMKR